VALPHLHPDTEDVFVLCSDTPLITSETLAAFADMCEEVAVIAMPTHPEESYGRLVFDADGSVKKIVEMKDASPSEKGLPLGNSGVYKVKKHLLESLTRDLTNENAGGEYYLTDLVEKAYSAHIPVGHYVASSNEFQGINTRQDLANAHAILQNRWKERFMNQGVTFVQPETVVLSFDTELGRDTTVAPFVTFGPGVKTEGNMTILPFCHLENCHLAKNTSVGPFAHIREHSILKHGASVGNFVEIKKSTLGEKTKAKHLSYIGDATLGDGVNIGAGTITCNYDGVRKFETVIDHNVLVGANVSLVAPVHVGEGSVIAAGSVITQNVDNDSLAIGRAYQINKPLGAKKLKEKQKKPAPHEA
jgi:bifunctional UDP-N-acetylglucosamine pyrophosphorylase/glucosamine-1-phosphate N-acetyltransferase